MVHDRADVDGGSVHSRCLPIILALQRKVGPRHQLLQRFRCSVFSARTATVITIRQDSSFKHSLQHGYSTPERTLARLEAPRFLDCDEASPSNVRWSRTCQEGLRHDGKPVVLFLCVHNAGRSQMALGFFQHLAGNRATAWSGGSEPGFEINPAAIAVMAERGIDISREYPKPWTDEVVRAADVVITMGCGDACPVFPGKRYEDWTLDDPAGQDVEAVRPIRDDIERRVRVLLDQLGVPAGG